MVEGGGWRVEGGGWRLEGRDWRVQGAGCRFEVLGWKGYSVLLSPCFRIMVYYSGCGGLVRDLWLGV